MTDKETIKQMKEEDLSTLKGLLIGVAFGSGLWIILGLVAWWVLSK